MRLTDQNKPHGLRSQAMKKEPVKQRTNPPEEEKEIDGAKLITYQLAEIEKEHQALKDMQTMSEMTGLSKRHHQAPKLNLKVEPQNTIAETINETVKSKY